MGLNPSVRIRSIQNRAARDRVACGAHHVSIPQYRLGQFDPKPTQDSRARSIPGSLNPSARIREIPTVTAGEACALKGLRRVAGGRAKRRPRNGQRPRFQAPKERRQLPRRLARKLPPPFQGLGGAGLLSPGSPRLRRSAPGLHAWAPSGRNEYGGPPPSARWESPQLCTRLNPLSRDQRNSDACSLTEIMPGSDGESQSLGTNQGNSDISASDSARS